MECNRDEALRAKEIAETKFQAKDFKGARKYAIKAQKIYPELEGISQMLMTFEVYISAEEDTRLGESNLYGVLGVNPLSDDEVIRRQYRKLALVLHPDKNRSVGAEGAFQLISQAWNVLSDKSKRTAYDKRHRLVFQQTMKRGTHAPSQNGFHSFAKTADLHRSKRDENPTHGHVPGRKKERRTFWTVCHRCKMQYEYLRMYVNHNLLCPNCQEAYFAVEIEPPSTKISKTSSSSRDNTSAQRATSGSSFQWVPFSESTGAPSAVQAANMVHQAYEKVKRERLKAQAAARKEEALQRRNLSSKRPKESSKHSEFTKRRKGVENFGTRKEKIKQVNCDSGTLGSSSCLERDTRKGDIKCLVMEKARAEIHMKLNDDISGATMVTNVHVLETVKENGTADVKDVSLTNGSMSNQNKLCEMSVDVPSPDFHCFDQDRTEKCFGENQVWAVYDDRDGMPRHYAMIQNVISTNPFKVKMSWLSPIPHLSWFLSGFSKTCGEFNIGRIEICESIEWFSHKVRWMKMKRSSRTVEIFPQKGDVWALYRNWSPGWNELTRDKVIRKYDMVEVLENYDNELGVIVIPLVKVAGFKSVFHHSLNSREIRRVCKEEMSRFSHQVPCHLHKEGEGSKVLKGCRELDPAAVPLQFLEVMSSIEEIEFMESDEFTKADDYHGNSNTITTTNVVEGIS